MNSEDKENDLGIKLVNFLHLKEAKDDNGKRFNPPRWNTAYGTKTAIGLYKSVLRILEVES